MILNLNIKNEMTQNSNSEKKNETRCKPQKDGL